MSHDPVRLCDDPAASAALRRALRTAAAAPPPAGFDPGAGLERLRAATRAEGAATSATSTTTTTGAAPSGAPAGAAQPGAHARVFRHATWWGLAAIGLASLVAMMPSLVRRTHLLTPRDARVELAPHAGAATAGAHTAGPAGARADAPADPGTAALGATASRAGADAPRAGNAGATRGRAVVAGELSGAPTDPNTTSTAPGAVGALAARSAAATLAGRSSAAAPTLRAAAPGDRGATAARPIREALAQPFADMLDNERERLEWAYSELGHNPRRALALSDARPLQFYGTQHREEWESLAIRALVRLGRRDEARARGRAYLARFPHGASSGFIRELVGQRPDAAR